MGDELSAFDQYTPGEHIFDEFPTRGEPGWPGPKCLKCQAPLPLVRQAGWPAAAPSRHRMAMVHDIESGLWPCRGNQSFDSAVTEWSRHPAICRRYLASAVGNPDLVVGA